VVSLSSGGSEVATHPATPGPEARRLQPA
jgi:hypothetical protein